MFIGIDIGSTTAKIVLMDSSKNIIDKIIANVGYSSKQVATNIYREILAKNNLKENNIKNIVSCGYGRESIDFAKKAVSEIICHAKGVHFLINDASTIIDIGGQDSKVIVLNSSGNVVNFVMNDKCAAGTGRFLDVMAKALMCDIEEFGTLALQSKKPANISSICTVFAESEVISLVAKSEDRNNIIAGLCESIAKRIASMYKRAGGKPKVVLTGGVAKNIGVLKALENQINMPILTHELSSFTGAIGACIISTQT
jgi:predicted CoA-substrate-specific enzyme activase